MPVKGQAIGLAARRPRQVEHSRLSRPDGGPPGSLMTRFKTSRCQTKEHRERTNGCSNQAGALIYTIPADRLTDERGKECARDSKYRCQDKLLRGCWVQAPTAVLSAPQ
jgi:hypothetical protein